MAQGRVGGYEQTPPQKKQIGRSRGFACRTRLLVWHMARGGGGVEAVPPPLIRGCVRQKHRSASEMAQNSDLTGIWGKSGSPPKLCPELMSTSGTPPPPPPVPVCLSPCVCLDSHSQRADGTLGSGRGVCTPLHLPIAKAVVAVIWPHGPKEAPEGPGRQLATGRGGLGSDVLERPYTAGEGGLPPPPLDPPAPRLPPFPPLPMFEADSQNFCFGAFSTKRIQAQNCSARLRRGP